MIFEKCLASEARTWRNLRRALVPEREPGVIYDGFWFQERESGVFYEGFWLRERESCVIYEGF